MSMMYAPFTADQIQSINEYQESGNFHPFTCGNSSNHPVLVATQDGMKCPKCHFCQKWVHEWMSDGSWKQK